MTIPYFLSIQGSYTQLEISLFGGNNPAPALLRPTSKCLQTISESNKKASSSLILYIEKILKDNSLNISDLQFICADQGPGAFTSLRVTISTINGLSFASRIPLIGIDGLDALSQETIESISENKPEVLVALLNAYNNEVYFSVNGEEKNYKNISILLDEIKDKFENKKIVFTGNGATLHKKLIISVLKDQAQIYDKIPVCSTKQIAKMALKCWKKKEGLSNKLYPLYLKSQTFAVQKAQP